MEKEEGLRLLEMAPADITLEETLQLQLLAIDLYTYASNARNSTIDDCIKRLGGRYGAAAIKDLQSLKTKSEF